MTYVNCSCFSILLLPLGARYLWHHIRNAGYVKRNIQERGKYILVSADASQADLTTINHTSAVDERGDSTNEFKNGLLTVKGPENDSSGPLTVKETIKLSLDFTLLWVSSCRLHDDEAIMTIEIVSGRKYLQSSVDWRLMKKG